MEDLITILQEAGWRRSEKPSVIPDAHGTVEANLTFRNDAGNDLYIEFLPSSSKLRLRIEDRSGERRYFMIDSMDAAVLDLICKTANDIRVDNYFSIYSKLSSVAPTSILAWEQFV